VNAAVLYGAEDVRIELVPTPSVGPGEIRVKIGAALTCGTDVKVFRRGYHARMIVPPAIFGHEFAGEIEALGKDVVGWRLGERVVAANSSPCGECYFCGLGRPELCEDLLFLNGAYAEYVTIPARIVRTNLLRIPEGVSYEEAAMIEPLACVVHGMAHADVKAGETVAVIGTGPIGLMFVRLCKLAGAAIIAVGRSEARLDVALEMGADRIVDANSVADIVMAVRDETSGMRGPDHVIECVGRPEVWEKAIAMARKAGSVNLFGGCPKDSVAQLDTGRVHYDELTLRGTFHHTPSSIREALRLIAHGSFPAKKLIQQTAPLSELPAVLKSLCNGNSAVKTAIYP
jgi:L-iditol 2-dehydrogenase